MELSLFYTLSTRKRKNDSSHRHAHIATNPQYKDASGREEINWPHAKDDINIIWLCNQEQFVKEDTYPTSNRSIQSSIRFLIYDAVDF